MIYQKRLRLSRSIEPSNDTLRGMMFGFADESMASTGESNGIKFNAVKSRLLRRCGLSRSRVRVALPFRTLECRAL